jgi:hypothetical protein
LDCRNCGKQVDVVEEVPGIQRAAFELLSAKSASDLYQRIESTEIGRDALESGFGVSRIRKIDSAAQGDAIELIGGGRSGGSVDGRDLSACCFGRSYDSDPETSETAGHSDAQVFECH